MLLLKQLLLLVVVKRAIALFAHTVPRLGRLLMFALTAEVKKRAAVVAAVVGLHELCRVALPGAGLLIVTRTALGVGAFFLFDNELLARVGVDLLDHGVSRWGLALYCLVLFKALLGLVAGQL